MQKVRKQKGFTLIELMIVIAIIGILAAVALPIYQDFIARSQVAEGMAAASAVKTSLTEHRMSLGAWPAANTYQNLADGRYTDSQTHTDAGVITVTMLGAPPVASAVQGYTFTLTPTVTGNDITDWTCNSATLKYLPSGCQ